MKVYANALVPIAVTDLDPAHVASPESPCVLCDITVDKDCISTVRRTGESPADPETSVHDLQGKLVFPGFIDAHTHLDKTHTWMRSPNLTRTFPDAIETLFRDEKHWTRTDLYRRASYALKCAHANGTIALRTHFNCPAGILGDAHEFFQALADEWDQFLTLQYVPLCTTEGYATPVEESYFARACETGCAAIGGMPLMNPELRQQLDRMFELAKAHEIGLDLHIDENPDPASETLREVALAVLRHEFPYPVACGHCCSLARQDSARQADTLDLVREAGIHMIPLPMCNLFLMDRRWTGTGSALSPFWRGTAPALEAMNRDITVAVASDNVRDAFFAYGNYDMLEVWNQANRILHLDSHLGESIKTVTQAPARILGLESSCGRIAAGFDARMAVFDSPSINHCLSRPPASRSLIVGERINAGAVPDWADLREA